MKKPDHKKQTILAALNKGKFVSGQELGEQLGISRAAIAKHIAALQEMGVDIFRVNGRGYKLNYSLPLIHQSKLNTLWQQQFQSECPIEYHAIIDSTNSELMRRLQDKQNMAQAMSWWQKCSKLAEGAEVGYGNRPLVLTFITAITGSLTLACKRRWAYLLL